MNNAKPTDLIPLEIRLTRAEVELLESVAKKQNVSVSEIIRNGIEFFGPDFDFDELQALMIHTSERLAGTLDSMKKTSTKTEETLKKIDARK